MPSALLISLRDPEDAMALHEHRCFAEAARIEPASLAMHHMVQGTPGSAQLRRVDAVFFGGSGAYSVYDDEPWIRDTLDLLLRVVDLGVPAFASCFGFHGLAMALGGEVIRDDATTEMGSTLVQLTEAGRADPLFSLLPGRFWAQEGHHDRVTIVPEGVVVLASSELCPEQAFRVDGAPFWASQFHPELTVRGTVERFAHYRDLYLGGRDAEAELRRLEAGAETPEVGELLARLVRRAF